MGDPKKQEKQAFDAPALDSRRRYVRVTRERENGFIEFNFSVGEPDLFVELILGRDAFSEFCANNNAVILPPEDGTGERGDWEWRLADAREAGLK